MLQINKLRENIEGAIELLKVRNKDFTSEINGILAADDKRKASQAELDSVLAESNRLSKEIGDLFKSGKAAEASILKEETVLLKEKSHALKEEMTKAEEEIKRLLYIVPNIPHVDVPTGKDDSDNLEVFVHGKIPELNEKALPHWDLATKLDIIDFELGNKIAGAGFPVYKDKGAKLQRALINYFIDKNTAAGYKEIQVPILVNEDSGIGTGQLPDKEGQMYHATEDNLYLIPTAEVPVTNFFRDVIVKEFPIMCTAYTPCFRREAGSYGKEVRGLNRLHQFDKVEIVQVQHPEKSYETLDSMVIHVKSLLRKLELPFRTLRLCGGDLGFTAALTFDLEVYSAAQKRWLEVSSVSNFETYQGK